jgi:hypothetical protein
MTRDPYFRTVQSPKLSVIGVRVTGEKQEAFARQAAARKRRHEDGRRAPLSASELGCALVEVFLCNPTVQKIVDKHLKAPS